MMREIDEILFNFTNPSSNYLLQFDTPPSASIIGTSCSGPELAPDEHVSSLIDTINVSPSSISPVDVLNTSGILLPFDWEEQLYSFLPGPADAVDLNFVPSIV